MDYSNELAEATRYFDMVEIRKVGIKSYTFYARGFLGDGQEYGNAYCDPKAQLEAFNKIGRART